MKLAMQQAQEESQVAVAEAQPIFSELRSCCGTLYGYVDQNGQEYTLNKEPVEDAYKAWEASGQDDGSGPASRDTDPEDDDPEDDDPED